MHLRDAGTRVGAFLSAPGDGMRVETDEFDMYRIVDGLIYEVEGTADNARLCSLAHPLVRRSSSLHWHCCCTSLLYATTADSDSAARPLSAECPHAILRLVQPHIMDLSTSNSAPGEDGSKPCSISQRAATRLRHDHHARITSRSTSVP